MKINFKKPNFEKLKWKNINKRVLLYSCAGVLSLGVIIPLGVYGLNEVNVKERVVEGVVTGSANSRSEYIIGETFNPRGLTFTYENQNIDLDKVTYTYDFTSAGHKGVTLSYQDGETTYKGTYFVEVFKVTKIEASDYSNVTIYSDGSVYAPDIKVVAVLNGHANEMKKDSRYPDFDSTSYILNEDQYTIHAAKSKMDNYYNVTLSAGGATYGWVNCQKYDIPDVSSTDRILTFNTMVPGSNMTLELFATYSSSCFTGLSGSEIEVRGTYVLYQPGQANRTFNFKYRFYSHVFIDGHEYWWLSQFLSEQEYHEGLSDGQGYGDDGDAMRVQIGDQLFVAPGASWHGPVLG